MRAFETNMATLLAAFLDLCWMPSWHKLLADFSALTIYHKSLTQSQWQ